MVTAALARFVTGTKGGDIGREVYEAARDGLIDTLGVMIAGCGEDPAVIVQRMVKWGGGRSVSTVFGTGLMTSSAEAAFANGVAAHALDFDDSMPTLRGHP